MNEIVRTFNGKNVRILDNKDGEPWFVAKDVCKILDIKNHRQSVSYLDNDERSVITNDTPSGTQ